MRIYFSWRVVEYSLTLIIKIFISYSLLPKKFLFFFILLDSIIERSIAIIGAKINRKIIVCKREWDIITIANEQINTPLAFEPPR